ncbi:tetratricopeptide repeat protein [Oesophagostomum dentatum]|uniref:Tetratricopeptide repeat protein n=1 Tax=Oesophagostomum dentatum TaxID=61180 RepID=A0A0B1SJ76_OESDE|nr:tetratricopeptide repeat protein [Oesophagostomum dentatum]
MNRIEEALSVKVSPERPPAMFVIDSARLSLLKGDDVEELIREFGQHSANAKRIRLVKALQSRPSAAALQDAEVLLKHDSVTWKDIILVAELNLALGKDPMTLLVKVHLRMFDKADNEDRFENLKIVFRLAEEVIAGRPRITLAYKLPADALLRVVKFRDSIVANVGIPASWSVTDRLSAVRSAVMFYSVALDLNRENAWAWSDLAVALLYQARLNNSAQHAVKASECLRKAMSLCQCAQTRSQVWTLLAEAERLSAIGNGATQNITKATALQQHYLVRALQLNKANDKAWLRLALLYYTNGAMDLAHLAIEEALKHNPLLAEAWCAYAMKADSEGVSHEATDMFRHSVSVKPIVG